MRLYVKYMVSHRCKLLVRNELSKLRLEHNVVELGIVDVLEEITPEQCLQLQLSLKRSGLELLDDKRSILVESIKIAIIQMIHYHEDEPKVNYSDYLSQELGYDYTYLANVFSEVKGITIQLFIILNKVERVKELILYDELSMAEIAHRLHYSSTSHLANQFKKVTGLTPGFYRGIANKRRKNLEDL